ncbi:hypothetical protein [Sphingomonas sp. 3-13AW]|uniref:hypothetical protein n=1 Tax=Sphingomonas sp. 3-13AW TaxID=3050450 RepID=UPI003BB5EB71
MTNPQQLNVVHPSEIQDIISQLMTKGFLGVSPVPVGDMTADAGVFEHGAAPAGSSVDGLPSHAMPNAATIISGPPEGGSLLDRPVGAFLSEQAEDRSISLEQFTSEEGHTYLAKRLAGAGEMEVGGVRVNAIDFVPGGDIVKLAAGEEFNANSLGLSLAKGLVEANVLHGSRSRTETNEGRALDGAGMLEARQIANGAGAPHHPALEEGCSLHSGDGGGGADAQEAPTADDQALGFQDGVALLATGRRRRQSIDFDTEARDMAIVGAEHALNLDNAVSQWDEQDVHTEMMLHGRKVEIDTHFDAHHDDNRKERDTAGDHAKEIPVDGNTETVTHGAKMAFRSQVHAHLEATARDEGITP